MENKNSSLNFLQRHSLSYLKATHIPEQVPYGKAIFDKTKNDKYDEKAFIEYVVTENRRSPPDGRLLPN